jgi:hypothetical protein
MCKQRSVNTDGYGAWLLERSRIKGRPRLRWQEDVEKDLREMKVKRWRQNIVDKKEWGSILKDAKALKGP